MDGTKNTPADQPENLEGDGVNKTAMYALISPDMFLAVWKEAHMCKTAYMLKRLEMTFFCFLRVPIQCKTCGHVRGYTKKWS